MFAGLLEKHLKDDEIIEVLENFDIDVIYDFDRLHEGMDDVYWATSTAEGFQFRFDEDQVLDTIFLYIEARDGFTPIARNEIDVPVFETFDAALRECSRKGISFKQSQGDPGTEMYKLWIKLDLYTHTVHYQFNEGALCMITLGSKQRLHH